MDFELRDQGVPAAPDVDASVLVISFSRMSAGLIFRLDALRLLKALPPLGKATRCREFAATADTALVVLRRVVLRRGAVLSRYAVGVRHLAPCRRSPLGGLLIA